MKHLANHSRKVTPQFAYVLSAFVLILLVSSWLVPARIGYMFVPRAAAAAFTVTNTNDGGAGSLRKAILDANVNSGPDTIGFNIPPTDPRHFYYQNDGVLGTVSQAMIAATTAADDATIANIDPDWPHSWYSILTNGTRIDIDSEVAIDGYSQPGAQPNTNATGGLNTVLRIEVTTADIPTFNCQSIFNTFSAQHTISGLIINRCGNSAAIYFDVNNTGSIAAGNFIGTDPSGTIALLNGTGIGVERSTIVRIGGNSPADRNLISGNFRGVVIASGTASGDNVSSVSVIGNLVGTARDGISPLGNGFSPQLPTFPEDAISIQSINGTALSNLVERNVIAFNSRYGVTLGGGGVGTTQAVTGNRITNNSIYSNGNIGINLDGLDQGSANAVTPNDPCDVDAGVNGLQNYPVIKDATISGSTIAIAGTLDSAANGSYRIEFFASQASDASFFGEGQTYLGFANVTTPMGSCTSSFSATFSIPPGAGNVISATARDISGNTSEFSAVFIAQAAADSCVMRPPGQVAWLRAQGNTNDSEAGNHGTFSPYTPTYTAGKVGRAFDFTGNVSGGIVRVPDSSDLDFTNAFTMEMWVSPGDVGHGLGGTFFAAKGSLGAASTQSYAMLFTDERKIVNRVSNGSTLDQAVSTAQLPLNTFTHVATTYDGTTLRVYINGVLNSSKATSIGTLLNSTGSLDIGGTFIPGLSLQRNQSLIDEPSLYNRALSDAEVLSIFNAGSMGKCFPRSCAPLLMMDSGSPDGTFGLAYTRTISASGGAGPYVYSLGNGSTLPPGLSLNPTTGIISGHPNLYVPGATYPVTVVATDQNGCTGSVTFSITINDLCSTSAPIVVAGDLVVVGSTATLINLSCVSMVTGDVNVSQNTAAGTINLSGLESVTGDVDVNQNTAAGSVNLSGLESVTGTVDVNQNTAAGSVNLAALTTSGGLSITDNNAATMFDAAALTTVNGDLDISGNGALPTIGMGALTSVNGGLEISGNGAAATINTPALVIVSGGLEITGNEAANSTDMGSLTTVSGELQITDNGTCTDVQLGSVTSVSGDVAVESCGTGTFAVGSGGPAGSLDLDTLGYTGVAGTTASGQTQVGNQTAEATMTVTLPTGAFSTPVPFTLTHLDPATLGPTSGTTSTGAPVSVDPVAAYQFTFGVPTLNQNASLTFDILLANLDAATRQALLDAVAIGQATLATRGDAAGSMYQAFPVCASGVPPTVGGCVSVELLDANGQPTMGMATTARFSNVVGHFSTWAVAIVASPSAANVSVGGRVLTAEGAGIGKAKVSITDAEGNTKIALTNPFGYYRFDDVEVGPAYLVSVEAKRHQFENPIRTVHVVDELSDINFIALPQNIAEARVSNLFSFPSRYRASRR